MAFELTCDKCGFTSAVPSHYHRTCNRHIVSEPTGYCQGIWRPTSQFTTGSPTPTWTNPGFGHKDGFQNQ